MFLGAALGPAFAQVGNPYRLVIHQVDSTNFPEIELRFQVFIQDIGVQAWDYEDPGNLPFIEEMVMGTSGQAQDIQPVEVCDEKPVIMGVAVDVSGSVSGVLADIKAGITALFAEMDKYADTRSDGKRDWGAVFAFSGDKRFRFPQEGDPTSYTDSLQDLGTVVQAIPAGGSSPIWVNMDLELQRLLSFKPQESDFKRVLATLTDGQNNQADEAINSLLSNAQMGGAQLFNLAYGSPNVPDLERIASASGGAMMPGADRNISAALLSLLNSVRTTYCVKYTSPFGNIVNEPADVTMSTANTQGSATYPLPFLIPEDSQDVALFFPMTEWFYNLIVAGDVANRPGVKAKMVLRDDDPDDPKPWRPETDKNPDRGYLDYEVGDGLTRWVVDPDSGKFGFEIPVSELVLSVPTDYVDINRDLADGEQLLSGAQHYITTAELVYSGLGGAAARAGRQYPSATRVSVQDRTPPHVFVKLRPQDGGPPLELQVLEGGRFNVDPAIVARMGLSNDAAHEAGTGDKRPLVRYKWRNAAGSAVEGEVEAEAWSRVDQYAPEKTEPGPKVPDEVFQMGIRIPETQRMQIEVLARDNFAKIAESTEDSEFYLWTDPDQLGPQDGDPNHAAFDFNRDAAQAEDLRPPFLPLAKPDELADDPSMAGVAWWVELNHAPIPGSQYETIENLPVWVFKNSDQEIRRILADDGEDVPPDEEPMRYFMLRAQDGQGNVTLLRIPLYVGDVAFDPMLVDWRRRRATEQE